MKTIVLAITLLLSTALQAQTIVYDNALNPAGTTPNSDSDPLLVFTTFASDNFRLEDNQAIHDIHWFGGYFNEATGLNVSPSPPLSADNFTIRFYLGDGTLPLQTAFQEYTQGDLNYTRTDTGLNDVVNRDIFKYDAIFNVPTPLLIAGTEYYVEIFNNTPDLNDPDAFNWFWAGSTDGDNISFLKFSDPGEWSAFQGDRAFALTIDAATTPSHITWGWMLMTGIALGYLYRTRNQVNFSAH